VDAEAMARRRKQEEKEEKEEEVFKFPEFDEREYIEKEIEKSKAGIGVSLIGILFAILSAFVFSFSLSWPLSAVIGLLAFLLFKFIYPLFKVDPEVLEKKDYVAHVFIYFFTWLSVFILLINTPFMDFTSPQISDVHMEGMYNNTWIPYNGTDASQYRIFARVTDNSGVSSVEIKVDNTWETMKALGDGRYEYVFSSSFTPRKGTLYEIRAVDVNGHESMISWVSDW
jgi:hypothetical protein